MEKKPSIDEILLEIGLSKPKPSSTSLDVDELLDSILKEKQVQPQQSRDELPTKIFRRTRKKVLPPVQAVSQQAPTEDPATEKKEAPVSSEASPVLSSENAGNTGNFSIDIEAIRAGQPAPTITPAQIFDEEHPPAKPQKEIRFHQRVEEDELNIPPTFMPYFAKLEAYDQIEQCPHWLELLEKMQRLLNLRTVFLSVCSVVLLGLTLMLTLNRASIEAFVPSLGYLIGMLSFGILAGAIGFDTLLSGCKSLIRFQPNRDLMPTVVYLVCLLQSLALTIFRRGFIHENIHFYLLIGVLSLTTAAFSHRLTVSTALKNLKFIIEDHPKEVPNIIKDGRAANDFTRGTVEELAVPVINQPVDLLQNFLRYAFASDSSDIFSRNLAFIGLGAALAAGFFVWLFTHSKHAALTIATALVAVLAPLCNLFATAMPLRRSANLNRRVNGLTASERAADEYGTVNALLIDAKKLFPPSFIVLNGIKTFEGMRIDEAILDAASLLIEADSILGDIFLKIIGSRRDLLRKVDNMEFEDGMGLSAWIKDKRILIGNRELMEHHGIRVPSLDYERRFTSEGSDLVYLASSGELTAVFVVTLHASALIEDAIHMLEDNGIYLSVRTTDSIITKDRLSVLFGTYRDYFKIIPARLHSRFDEEAGKVKVKPANLANDGGLVSTACSLSAAKRIRVMVSACRVVQMVSICLGVVLILCMTLFGAFGEITPIVLTAYLLIWLLIDLLIQRLIQI